MLNNDIYAVYNGCKVLVTGHSGFKGGWLTAWLSKLGADVTGVSLPPDQGIDNLYERAHIAEHCKSHWLDIRDADAMQKIVASVQPKIIFHLAAQPLVQRSYAQPLETFATNVMGGANILEAARKCKDVKAFVFVTSDKVYDNKEWCWAYRENDPLGGLDPYSASKSAAEMVAISYMSVLKGDGDGFNLATARGGNVVGGGDWSESRIVPDIVRALRANDPLVLRHPNATRPWQHVLELCAGYLTLGVRLLNGFPEYKKSPQNFVGSYNFGPERSNEMSVHHLTQAALKTWGNVEHPIQLGKLTLHEATYLRVDSSKAQAELAWRPRLTFEETMSWTMNWYKRYVDDPLCTPTLVDEQISAYANLCKGI